MIVKKKPEADLSRTRMLYTNVGLIIALSLVIGAFSYRTYEKIEREDLGSIDAVEDDQIEIPITVQPPPPPPKVVIPKLIVVPEEEIEEEIELNLDTEITDDTEIEETVIADEPEEEVADEIFTIVEQQPAPEGGMAAFYSYVGKKLKYPSQARRLGIEGKVYVQFVVSETGHLSDIKVVRGIGAGCDAAAVKVVQGAPPWKPGKQRGKPVKVRMVIPINFKLN